MTTTKAAAAAAAAAAVCAVAVALERWRRRKEAWAYESEIARLASTREALRRASTVDEAEVLSGVEVWALGGKYYQVLGHAWDHEAKDFKVVYRPLYSCAAKPGRYEAHLLACTDFSRWEGKFERVADLTTVPPGAARLILAGPFALDPRWPYPDRTRPTAASARGLGARSHRPAEG